MTQLICFCFEYTESDIKDEMLLNNSKSLLLGRIIRDYILDTGYIHL